MSENLGISKFSLMEKTGCGTGAVAPAARNSRIFCDFFAKFPQQFFTNFREFREILANLVEISRRFAKISRNSRKFVKIC